MWIPQFACPECAGKVGACGPDRYVCGSCSRQYERCDGIWRFLAAERAEAAASFARQYRAVRDREGYRASSPDYYRKLPDVASNDPHAGEWRVRRETYEHLCRRAIPRGGAPVRILDLGAGCCWMAHRLAALGHEVVSVDLLDDEADGLGAVRHYPDALVAVQADYEALPFAPHQFDLVVFNGSLHYARSIQQAMTRASEMLTAGGRLAVMDSPTFRRDSHGRAMVEDKLRRFRSDYGLVDVVRPSAGYLTFSALADAAARLDRRGLFVRSRGSIGWRVRRALAWPRLGRAPAAFGLWVAE